MKAYILASDLSLYPFGDLPDAWRVGDRLLPDLQDEALRACGLEPVRVSSREAITAPPPHLILDATLYFTPEAIGAFLASVRRAGRSARAAVAPGLFADQVLWHVARGADGAIPLPLWYVKDEASDELLAMTVDEDVHDVRLPPQMATREGKGLELLLTRRPFVPITHWVSLWQANMQALFAMTARAQQLPWPRKLWAFARGGGNLYGAMGQLNTIGKNCRIHPTAVVELSEIGDDVEIGAYAVVRMSVIGRGSAISDHASVRGVVVGEGSCIANNNNVMFSLVYPNAFLISGPYQFSVFGRECVIMHCICCDTRLDGRGIKAEVAQGTVVGTPLRYLGSCYGHEVRAGAGTITGPGRAIPNGIHFLPNPNQVVNQIEASIPRAQSVFTSGGGLTTTWERW